MVFLYAAIAQVSEEVSPSGICDTPLLVENNNNIELFVNCMPQLRVDRISLQIGQLIERFVLPTYSDFAAATLNNMKDTYRILPIPAYKQGGGLMYPTMYKHQLVGATVILNFTLTHWFILVKLGQMQEVSDIYSVELLSMRVVHLPLPTIVSPCKRKVSTIDPFSESGSPSKKSKKSD